MQKRGNFHNVDSSDFFLFWGLLHFLLLLKYNFRSEFVVINPGHRDSPILDEYLQKRIGELYGDETVNYWTRKKMWYKKDRIVLVLKIDGRMVGNLIYKTELSSEYEQYGIVNSLEVKSLYLFDADENSGKGYGTLLFEKLMEVYEKSGADSIHVTVSEKVEDSEKFFLKKGFVKKTELQIPFKPNVKQYLMQYCWPADIPQLTSWEKR